MGAVNGAFHTLIVRIDSPPIDGLLVSERLIAIGAKFDLPVGRNERAKLDNESDLDRHVTACGAVNLRRPKLCCYRERVFAWGRLEYLDEWP